MAVGAHLITAVYNADTNFTGSTSSALAQTVNQASTTTTITAHTPSPSVVGQPVTINFNVAPVAPGSGTPTGTVTVSDSAGDACSASVATGTCSITFNTTGTKSLTASYPGDTNFTSSASSPATTHTVNAASTTTTITAHTPNPSVIGQPITVNFTVTVNSPGTGTIPGSDTVTVSDGTGDSCSGTVTAGTCQLTPATSGAKTLTATFAGDTNFATSASAGVAHTVNKRATITSVNMSLSTVVVGQPSSATVTVTDTDTGTQTNPTGTVTFSSSDAGDTFGICTLAPSGPNAATCTASVTPSKVGTSPHSVTATFPADSTHATSNGNANLTVSRASTTTAIPTNTPNPSTVGQGVTINYSVSVSSPGAGTPTGTVTVSDGLGDTCTASFGAGNCQITFNTAGTKNLIATYAGDANFSTSASGGTSQTVNPKLVVTSTAFAILTGTCSSQVTVQTQNNDGTGATGARTLNLSSSSGSGTFYNDAACSSPTSTANIGVSASTAGFFYKDSSIGSPVITVASPGLTSTTQTEAITGLRFNTTAFSVQINSCSSAITLQSANAQSGGPTSLTQAATINLSSSSANGKFYSNPTCTTQITSTVIGNGFDANHDSPNFYYEDTSAGGPTITASAGTASAQQTESVVTPPSISKAFGAAAIPVNGTTSLTLTITNPAANTVALTGVAFTDNLPAGLVVSTPSGLSNTCTGTATATAGSGSVGLSGGSVAVNNSCKVVVNITGTTSGVKNNTTGAVTSTNGGTGNTASASTTVATPPTISKAFGAASLPLNASTSLTFTINNPNTIGLTGLAFTDGLPAGLVVATPNNLSSSCGTATALAGSSSVSLSGGTVAASSSCSISVNVTGTITGVKNNTTGAISATESGPGAVSNTASLTVNARSSSTTIAPLTATAAIGQGTNFTVTVTDTDSGPASTPTGNVGVSSSNGTDSIGACTLAQTVAGTAACSVTITPAAPTGTHNISASFTANDSVHANSSTTTSAALTVTNPATSTAVMSSPNPSTFGQSVSFTATVSSTAGTPTGSMTFYEGSCGGTLLAGPVALDVNGQAPFSKSDFNAGSHTVFACYTPTGVYLASSGSVSQQVNQAQATLSFGTLTFVYDGNLKPTTVTTNPANLTGVSILYNGSSTPPMNAGSTPVTASLSNTNYVATPISDTEVIQQAPIVISVTDPNVTYDGNPHTATIGVFPNVPVMVTYNGSATAPTSAGVYTVMVTVTDSNYSGTGSGTLTINKATPTINWANPADISYGTALNGTQLNATATFNSNPVPGTFTYTPATGTVLPAGNGQTLSVAFAPTDSTDFNSVPFTTVLINVKADPLYVISPDNSRPFGASDSPLTPTLSPTLVNGDTAQSIGGPMCNAATTTSSAPGTYAIVCSGVTSNNYSVTYINGTLSITNPLTAITAVTDTQGGTIQIGQTDQLTATGQFADNHPRTLASAGGLSFSRANLATPVFGAAVAEAGGVLYAIGGSDGTNTLGAIQAYNPKTNTWNTISAALATARSNAAAASVAGRIYIIGGSDGSKQLASIEVLDTTSGTPTISTFSGTASVARSDAAAVVWDQKLYVIGGSNGGSPQSTVDIFDLVLGTALTADAGIALDASAAVLNNKLYVLGTSGSSVQAVNFDGSNWSAPSATPLDATQGIGVTAYNNLLYIVNGTSVWSYDGTNFTQESNPLGHAHNGAQPVAIGSRIYVASAGSGSANSNLDAFAPPEVTWAPTGTNHADANIDQSGNVTALARTDNANPNYVTLTATSIANNSLTGDFQLTIDRKSQTITFGPLADKTYGDADFSVSATASSTLSVTFGASGNCNVSGTTVHIIGAGSCSITSSQGGDDEWQPATDVMRSFNINKADAAIAVTGYTVTYDGNAHTATGTATGAFNERLAGLDLSGTSHTDAGTYTDNWAFTDSTGNYNNASGTVSDCIKKATATVVVTPYTVTYDGNPHTATVTSITGVNGETGATVGTVTLNTTHTAAGTYASDSWSFTGTANYNIIASTPITDTINKATAVVVVTPYTVTYDGSSHTATVTSITGVNGETGATVGTVDVSNTAHTPAGTYSSDSWSFTGTANYNNIASTTISDTINKATAVVVVTPYTVTYDGSPHTATVTSITGVNGETGATVGTVDVGNTTHTPAGTYSSDSWSFTGTANYNNIASTTITDTINKATAVVVVTPYSVTYDGNAHTATVTSITGVNGETGATVGTVTLNTTHTAAGTYASDSWSFTGTANYNIIASTPITDTINKATAVVVVTPYTVTYDGSPHTATVTSITGVNGEMGATVGTVDVSSTAHIPAGTYSSDSWSFTGTANYNNIASTPITDSIAQAPLTITASSAAMFYGGPVPAVMPGYSGFVNGEGPSNLMTQPSCGTYATSSSFVGTYASLCVGAVASNYDISYTPGAVIVSPATTTTTVISSVNPSNWGQVVTLTATVSAPGSIGTPTGTVSFYNAASGATCASPGTSTLLDKEPLATIGPNQQASTSTPTLPVGPGNTVGNDTILACYNGDSTDPIFNPNFAPSSGALTQTVNPAPIASLSPTSLSFGNQQGGTTSGPQYVYVSNPTGTASLSIASITLTGTNPTYFTETNNCTSVAIGGSCTITVKFAPPASATGVATANLVVTDNSGNVNGSRQSSLLTGAGTSSISSVGSLSTYAIFATANGCSSLNVSGNGTVDSFNSSFGSYGSSHQNSGGNVGTDGNVTLSGNPVVYGTAASPFGGSGNCSTKSMTGYSTSGKAQATGGQVVLPQALTYPAPSAPNPTPPTTTQNISGSCGSIAGCVSNGSKNVILAPGVYGNLSVSGGTTVNVSGGTYNMNSLTLSGNSTLVVTSGTGAVVVNLAGKSVSGGNTALDLSGGVMSNASGLASNLQFYYAGAQPIKLSGGAGSYAVVYAPNAPINVSGGAHFYGAMVGSTINSSGGTAFHYDGNLPNIQAGNFVWFNSAALNVQGLPTNGSVKVYVTNASISFPSTSSQCTGTFSSGQCTLPVPNAVVTFSSTASTASTTWDAANSRWSTLVPTNGSTTIQTHTFLDGLAYLVPNGGFPSGIQNVTWSAAFSTSTTGISFNWQWGAAVYNSFTNNYSSLTVNPVDGSDPAGTPQNYKANLIFGATGPGYTGLYVGTAGVVPTIAEASAAPSSLDFGSISQTIGTGSSTLTATLNNNQSGSLTISSITVTGTNPSDFGQTNNCPISPATLAGGSSCTITVTFTPTTAGKRTAKIAVNDSANNSPQTVFLKGTGQ